MGPIQLHGPNSIVGPSNLAQFSQNIIFKKNYDLEKEKKKIYGPITVWSRPKFQLFFSLKKYVNLLSFSFIFKNICIFSKFRILPFNSSQIFQDCLKI